jgi:hypothetical protein
MFILQRLIYTVGTEKKRSLSESRGDHLGGGQNQQKSLGGTGECSVRQGDHFGGVFSNRGFTVYGKIKSIVFVMNFWASHLQNEGLFV